MLARLAQAMAVISLLLLGYTPLCSAQAEDNPSVIMGSGRVDQRVGKLANGLSYFVQRAEDPAEKVLYQLIVRVGAPQSLPDQQNVAHVVEHIVFASSPTPDAKNGIWDRLRLLGALPGNDANASTGDASTSYFVKLPSGDPSALNEGLNLLRDWIMPRELSDAEITRERAAVIEEFRRSGSRRLTDMILRTRFSDIPAYRNFSSDPSGMLSATPASIRSLHEQWYTPQNMAVIIVGDVDPDMMVRELTARVAAIPSGKFSPTAVDLRMTKLRGGAYVSVPQPGAAPTTLTAYYHYEKAPSGTAQRLRQEAVALLAEPLLLEMSDGLRERHSPPATIYGIKPADPYSISRLTGVDSIVFEATVRPGAMRQALAENLKLASMLRTTGFSVEDIERARTATVAQLESKTESISDMAERWSNLFVYGAFDPTPMELARAASEISPAEVNVTLAKWLDPAHRDIILAYPEADAATVPEASEMSRLMEDADRGPPLYLLAPEIEEPALSPVLPMPVKISPGKVVGNGYTAWDLPRSNAKLLFRRTDSDQIYLGLLRRGGLARFDPEQAAAVNASIAVVRSSGLGGLDTFELSRFLSSRRVVLDVWGKANREGLSLSGPVEQWPLLIRLARAQLLQPQCGKRAFAGYVSQRTEELSLEDAGAADEAAFYSMVAVARGDMGRADAAEIASFDYETVCSFYAGMFSDTQDMVIAVEGNIEPQAAYSAVAATLDIPAMAPRAAIRPRHLIETVAGRETLHRGAKPLANVAMVSQRATIGDHPIGELVGPILRQRMQKRLREVENGTYSVQAFINHAEMPGRTIISISFECDPENVNRLVAAAKEEFDKLRREGVTADEIKSARATLTTGAISSSQAAEEWISHGRLKGRAPVADAAVQAWIRKNIDVRRLREFVRLPAQ